jgi:hypothetical protein
MNQNQPERKAIEALLHSEKDDVRSTAVRRDARNAAKRST